MNPLFWRSLVSVWPLPWWKTPGRSCSRLLRLSEPKPVPAVLHVASRQPSGDDRRETQRRQSRMISKVLPRDSKWAWLYLVSARPKECGYWWVSAYNVFLPNCWQAKALCCDPGWAWPQRGKEKGVKSLVHHNPACLFCRPFLQYLLGSWARQLLWLQRSSH